jgi:NitT/TauT family transport system substrate-binding protein
VHLLLSVLLMAGAGCHRQQDVARTVRLATTGGGAIAYLPIYAGGPSGCFAKEGIDVRLEETAGSTKSMQALVGGSADVAACDYISLLNVTNQGQPVRAFVLLQKIPGFVAVVSPDPTRPITRLEDVKGRSIGVTTPGGAYHLLFSNILQQHGVNPAEVKAVGVGGGMALALALERGVVDVGVVGPLVLNYLQRRHPSLLLLADTRTPAATKAYLGAEEIAFFVLSAREQWLAANPQSARKLAASMQCALTWVHSHAPQQIREILPMASRSPDEQSDLEAIASVQTMFTKDGRMTAEAHAAALRLVAGTTAKGQPPYTNDYLGK